MLTAPSTARGRTLMATNGRSRPALTTHPGWDWYVSDPSLSSASWSGALRRGAASLAVSSIAVAGSTPAGDLVGGHPSHRGGKRRPDPAGPYSLTNDHDGSDLVHHLSGLDPRARAVAAAHPLFLHVVDDLQEQVRQLEDREHPPGKHRGDLPSMWVRASDVRRGCAALDSALERLDPCPPKVQIWPAPVGTGPLQSAVTETVLPAPPSVNPLGSALMGSCRHSLDDVQRSQVQILPPLPM